MWRVQAEKAMVADKKLLLCVLTVAVSQGIDINCERHVYLTSRVLKHLYDKKPAEEFSFVLNHFSEIVRYPDRIYKNKKEKRGEYCFVKKIGNEDYFCSLEIVKIHPACFGQAIFGISKFGESKEKDEIQIATAFRLRDNKYIKKYTLLWNWGDGNPHRSVFDTPEESTHAPQ